MRLEAKVGLFVLAGFLSLFLLSTKVRTIAFIGKEGYDVITTVENAAGLTVNTKVKINGVDAGYIRDIRLEKGRPQLVLFIYDGNRIAQDSIIRIAQESLLGGNYIDILYGSSDEMVPPGGHLGKVRSYAGLDQTADSINAAAQELKRFMEKLNATLDNRTQTNFQEMLADFRAMAQKISTTADTFTKTGDTINERLPRIMAQLDSLTREFNRTGADLNARLPELLERFTAIEKDIQAILAENRQPLNDAIHSVDSFFTEGEKAVKKIDHMFSKVNQSELRIGLRDEYLTRHSYHKQYFTVDYVPSPSTFYMLAAAFDQDNTQIDPLTGDYITPGDHQKGKTYLSAQMGKRYDDLLLRAGLIENSGGLGIDYFAAHDTLQYSLEAFDTSAQNDVRGENPHLKATIRYQPFKHINLYAGYDNFINPDAASLFVGAGINFIDDDLKYLLVTGATAGATN